MLSERSQTQKATECMILYTKGDVIRTNNRSVVWVRLGGRADYKGAAGESFGGIMEQFYVWIIRWFT